jgi:Hydrolytic ATP binding site of dynein motor region/Dynein heavy chain, N-terminal region 2
LIILSQGSDPLSMNDHYEKVFDAISCVEHNKKDKTIIEKMHGDGGQGHEVVLFSAPVRAVGNIEDWLCDLLKKMQLSMKDLARSCANDVISVQNDLSQLRSFVDNYISQFALLGVQMLWTRDQGEALDQMKTKKNSMKDCNQRQSDILKEMSSWCLQDLGSAVNRRKIETLVTIHVHQRDVTSELAALARNKRITDANDFEWLKQARFYWRNGIADDISPDGTLGNSKENAVILLTLIYDIFCRRKDSKIVLAVVLLVFICVLLPYLSSKNGSVPLAACFLTFLLPPLFSNIPVSPLSSLGAAVVGITDVDFNYQFEYLGAKERLVVTPLTDRAYITLAQALGMFFGGAPAGPAGTGKTETVKDLGRSLGLFVVVTNCTDQQSYLDCAKIFKGLCMAGLWGCFDEFNRIRLPGSVLFCSMVISHTGGDVTAVHVD